MSKPIRADALRAAIRREKVILEQLAHAGDTEPPIIKADMGQVNAALNRLWMMAEDVLSAARRPDQPEATTLRAARNAIRALEAAVEAETAEPASAAAPPADDSPKKKPRRARRSAIRPLTEKQTEAAHLVGEHDGNVTAAASVLGITRQAMQKRYNTALRKLGKAALPQPKTQRLPRDRRGQEIV